MPFLKASFNIYNNISVYYLYVLNPCILTVLGYVLYVSSHFHLATALRRYLVTPVFQPWETPHSIYIPPRVELPIYWLADRQTDDRPSSSCLQDFLYQLQKSNITVLCGRQGWAARLCKDCSHKRPRRACMQVWQAPKHRKKELLTVARRSGSWEGPWAGSELTGRVNSISSHMSVGVHELSPQTCKGLYQEGNVFIKPKLRFHHQVKTKTKAPK